jgi:hypothetical protein
VPAVSAVTVVPGASARGVGPVGGRIDLVGPAMDDRDRDDIGADPGWVLRAFILAMTLMLAVAGLAVANAVPDIGDGANPAPGPPPAVIDHIR